jgi:hypothetical protein
VTIAPIVMVWREADVFDPEDGSIERRRVMVPVPKYRPRAERQYEDGAEYTLAPVEPRSRALHSRYFAALNEAFHNLPEKVSARWENVEHFRKWVLIETGWYHEKDFTFEGRRAEAEARRLAAFIRTEDDYARMWVTKVAERPPTWKVIIHKAKSQDHASMKNEEFKESSNAVLDFAAQLIGTRRGELNRHAGRSA